MLFGASAIRIEIKFRRNASQSDFRLGEVKFISLTQSVEKFHGVFVIRIRQKSAENASRFPEARFSRAGLANFDFSIIGTRSFSPRFEQICRRLFVFQTAESANRADAHARIFVFGRRLRAKGQTRSLSSAVPERPRRVCPRRRVVVGQKHRAKRLIRSFSHEVAPEYSRHRCEFWRRDSSKISRR